MSGGGGGSIGRYTDAWLAERGLNQDILMSKYGKTPVDLHTMELKHGEEWVESWLDAPPVENLIRSGDLAVGAAAAAAAPEIRRERLERIAAKEAEFLASIERTKMEKAEQVGSDVAMEYLGGGYRRKNYKHKLLEALVLNMNQRMEHIGFGRTLTMHDYEEKYDTPDEASKLLYVAWKKMYTVLQEEPLGAAQRRIFHEVTGKPWTHDGGSYKKKHRRNKSKSRKTKNRKQTRRH